MGHGHPDGVGRCVAAGEVGENLPRDGEAVLGVLRGVFHGVALHQFALGQLALGPEIARIELDGEVERLLSKGRGVGAPEHRGAGAPPGHDGGGVGGDGQGRGVAGHDGVGDGARLVVRLVIGGAVVGGEGEGHLAHRLVGGSDGGCQRIVRIGGDGGDLLIAALPGTGDGRGVLAVRARDFGGEGGPVVPAQGQLLDIGVVRLDGDAVHVHIGGHGEIIADPEGVHPAGLIHAALVDLEGGRIGPIRVLLGDDDALLGNQRLVLGDDHLADVVVVAVGDHHLEGGGAALLVIVGDAVVKGLIHVHGEGDAGGGVVFAGGEAGGGKPEDQALQRHALNIGVEAGPITEHIGNAADAGDGQFFVVALLYRVPRQQGGACGVVHPEVGGGEVYAVDVHHRTAFIYLHQLVELQQDGYPLAGAVGAGGGDLAGGVVAVVLQGDRLAIVADGKKVERSVIVPVLLRHLNIHQGDLCGDLESRGGIYSGNVDVIGRRGPHVVQITAPCFLAGIIWVLLYPRDRCDGDVGGISLDGIIEGSRSRCVTDRHPARIRITRIIMLFAVILTDVHGYIVADRGNSL